MNRNLILSALLISCITATFAEDSLDTQIAAIVPKLAAEKEPDRAQPQKDLEKIEMSVSVPGKDAERSTYCNAIVAALNKDMPVPAKLWLLRSLERVGRIESIPAEVKLIADPDDTVREAAIRALANNSAEESARIIAANLLKTTDSKMRAALINALGYKKVPDAEKLLAKDTTHPDENVRNAARAALARIGHRSDSGAMAEAAMLIDMGRAAQPGDIPKIIAALDSPNIKIRQAAVQASGLNGTNDMTAALAEKLKSANPETKVAMLAALGQRGSVPAMPAIIEELKNSDNAVKAAAAKALGKIGDGSCVAPLMALIGKSTDDVQRAVRDSLDVMRGEAVEQILIVFLSDANVGLRAEAAQRLGARLAVSSAPALVKLLSEDDARPRAEAIKSLALVGGKNELDPIFAFILDTAELSNRDQAIKTALAISRKLPAETRADATIAALKSAPEGVQPGLLNNLSQLGGITALETVKESFKTSNKNIQDYAIRALANWSDPAALSTTLAIAKSSDNETHRVLALRGYFRLAALPSSRPATETTALFLEGLKVAKNADDKKLAVAGLAEVNDIAAFKKCVELISDPAVTEEACAATVKSAKFFLKSHPAEANAALQTVLEKSKNAATKKQASALK